MGRYFLNRIASISNISLIGIGFGLLYWFIDAVVQVFLFREGSLVRSFFMPSSEQIWMRSLIIFLMVVFSAIMQSIINRRKQIEGALQESEERYRRLADAASEAIVIHDGEKIIDANMTTARLLGYELQELIGQPPLKFIASGSHEEVMRNIRKGHEKPYRVAAKRKDGSSFPIEINARMFKYRGHNVRVAAITDISGRRNAEEAPAVPAKVEVDDRYQKFLRGGNDPLYIVELGDDGTPGNIIEFNEMAGRKLGYDPEEVSKLSFRNLCAREEYENIRNVFETLRDFKHTIFETDLISKAGDKVPVELSCRLLELEERPVVIISARETSERKKVEDSLRIFEKRFRRLYQSGPLAFQALDESAEIVDVNERWTELTGYSREEAIGTRFADFLTEKSAGQFKNMYDKIKKAQKVKGIQFDIKCKDSRVVTVYADGLADKDEIGQFRQIQLFLNDVTRLARLDKQQRADRQKLEHLLNSTGEMVLMLNMEGRFIEVNQAVKDNTAWEAADLDDKSFVSHIHPDDRDCIEKIIKKLTEGDHVPPLEVRFQCREGEYIPLEIKATTIETEKGEKAIFGLAKNLLKKNEIVEEMKESIESDLYRIILEQAEEAVCVLDSEFNIILANPAFADFSGNLGTPFKEPGENLFDMLAILPEDFRDECRAALSSREAGSGQYEIKKDGNDIILEVRIIPVVFSESPDRLAVFFGTAARETESGDSTTGESRIPDTIFESIDQGLITVNTGGEILNVNLAAARVFGLPESDMIGKNLFSPEWKYMLEDGSELPPESHPVSGAAGSGQIIGGRILCIFNPAKKQSRWVESCAVPIGGGQSGGAPQIYFTFRDITVRRRALQLFGQRLNLGLKLGGTSSLDEVLRITLDTALKASELDCGGIYLLDEKDGALNLVRHEGTGKNYFRSTGRYEDSAEETRSIVGGKCLYYSYADMKDKKNRAATGEGIKSIAFCPLRHGGAVIGCITAASRNREEIPPDIRQVLEVIAFQAAGAIVRSRTETSLKDSETRFRQMAETINEVFWMSSVDGTELIYVSPAYEQVWGKSLKSLYESPGSWMESVHPEDREMVENSRARRLSGDYDIEFRIVRPDGDVRWIRDRGYPIKNEYGEICRVVGISEDITLHKLAALELKAERDLSRSIIDSARAIIMVLDKKGNIININPYMEELGGHSLGDVIGRNWAEVYQPEDEKNRDRTQLNAGKSTSRIKTREGRILSIEWYSNTLESKSGGTAGTLAVGLDITAREHTFEALCESEAELNAIFNNASSMMMLVDENLAVKKVNRPALIGTGRKEEDVIGKAVHEVLGCRLKSDRSDDHRGKDRRYGCRLEEMICESAEQGREFRKEEITLEVAKDGKREGRVFLATVVPIEMTDETRALVSLDDITELHRIDETLNKVEKERSAVLENMSEMLAYYDADLKVQWANKSSGDSVGEKAEDLIGRHCYEIWHQSDKPCQGCPVIKARDTGKTQEGEIETPDGRTWFIRGNPVFDEEGKLAGLVELTLEITERKKMEQALGAAEKKFRLLFESTPDGIIVGDLDGNIIDANRSVAAMTGYDLEEIRGKSYDAIVDDKWHEYIRNLPSDISRDEVKAFEVELKTKNGDTLPVFFTAWVIQDADGRPVQLGAHIKDVSERKLAEEKLKYQAGLLDSVSDAIISTDMNRSIMSWNRGAENIYGWTAEEALGRDIYELTSIASPDRDKEAVNLELLRNGYWGGEIVQKSKSGEDIYTLASITVIGGSTGHPSGIAMVTRDITDYKKAREALEESEETLKELFDNISSGVIILEPTNDGQDFIIKNINQASEKIDGRKKENTIGRKLTETYPNVKESGLLDWIRKTRETGQARFVPMTLYRDDRIAVWWEGFIYSLSSGEIVVVYDDVTERKAAEEALRESEEKFRNVVQLSADGITLTDEEGRIIEWNRGQEQITGLKRENVLGQKTWDVQYQLTPGERKTKEYYERLQSTAAKRSEEGEPDYSGNFYEMEIIRHDGALRNIETIAFPIKTDRGIMHGSISRDITERKMLEREIAKAQKLESVGILAGGIAHDFNNILTAILGNISLAKMDTPADSELYLRLDEAEKASERAQELTRQLLTFSRGGSPVKRSTSVAEIIRESVAFSLRGSGIKGKCTIADNLRPVEIDPGQINQVLNNLMINAAQAMPDGGTVEIEAADIEIRQHDRMPLKEGSYVRISVTDHGVGIPRENLPRIFDPNSTTKQNGSGLGLATTYSIIKNHDGYINIVSEQGTGTTFTIYLPASDKVPESRGEIIERELSGGGRILVMDDEDSIRRVAGITLSKLGYEVDFADRGEAAIEKYASAMKEGRPFAAVVMDLTIPGGLGGKETIARLREIDPNVKAIVTSGYYNDPIMADFKKYGFSGIVIKPFKAGELGAAVRSTIGERQDGRHKVSGGISR